MINREHHYYTMTRSVLLLILVFLPAIKMSGQSNIDLYTPVTVNSPLFSRENELQIGASLNNFGLNYKVNGQWGKTIVIAGIQHNPGSIEFDPLNFNIYSDQTEPTHLIQSRPDRMMYCEFGLGYNLHHKTQKICFLAGVGRQIIQPNTRWFLQFDWGNESRLINAGITVRANYTKVNGADFFTMEPMVQGKLKIWNLRIVNQFGYCVAMKRHEDYMKPVLTVGLEYVIGKAARNKGYKE